MGGSLRAETTPDERAVWLDFLCLAAAGYGRFDCANRDALAAQLLISRELLDRAIKKFTDANRLSVRRDKRERKEVFAIIKWAQYQAFPRSHHKKTGGDVPSPSSPSSKKRNINREKEREREQAPKSAASFSQKAPKSAADFPPLPDIPKSTPFKVQDKLKHLRHSIRENERRLQLLLKNPQMEVGYLTKDVLEKNIQDETKEFRELIEDYGE
jgi:hypothetical protein